MQQSAKSIWLESAQKYLRKEVGSEAKTFQMIVLLLLQVPCHRILHYYRFTCIHPSSAKGLCTSENFTQCKSNEAFCVKELHCTARVGFEK